MISYAQNFEDVFLNRVFGGQNYGFYVDIGAYHPVDDSVTKAFYDRGWNGINIEPGEIFEQLAPARPRDLNLNMAVFDRSGEITFFQHPGWHAGLSRVQDERVPNTAAATEKFGVDVRTVPCDTLANILGIHAPRRAIAFLKIDAEGSEGAIIRSTDWRMIRPLVLVIEATLPLSTQLDNQDWEPVLLEQGYIRAYFDGINCFYVPDERPDLLRHFEVPINVLDGVTRYADHRVRSDLEQMRHEARALLESREELHSTLQRQVADWEALAAARDADRVAFDAERAALQTAREADRVAFDAERAAFQDAMWTEQVASQKSLDALRVALEDRKTMNDRLDAECVALRAERDLLTAQQNRDVPPLTSTGGDVQEASPSATTPVLAQPSRRRRLLRSIAVVAYTPIRPLIRPVMWRIRTFMVSGLSEQVSQLNDRIPTIATEPAPAHILHAVQAVRQEMAGMTTQLSSMAAELNRVTEEVENTVITLALHRREPIAHQRVPLESEVASLSHESHSIDR